jgi:small conductance mechanosensitive channel
MEKVGTLIEHPHGFEHMVSRILDSAAALGVNYGMRTVGALLILLIGWFVAVQAQHVLLGIARKSPRIDLTIASFLGGLAKYLIIAFTIVAMLSSFGVETTSVVAIMGAAGIAIGLALQGTLSNVAAGFMLVLFRPFRVGDAVETAGVVGTVTDVSLFTTEIRSDHNIRIIVPNNSVWSGVTKNMSAYATRRTDLEFPIPFAADFEGALAALTDAVQRDERILKHPAPVIGVAKFTDATARLTAQVWTSTAQAAAVQLEISTLVWQRLGFGKPKV